MIKNIFQVLNSSSSYFKQEHFMIWVVENISLYLIVVKFLIKIKIKKAKCLLAERMRHLTGSNKFGSCDY